MIKTLNGKKPRISKEVFVAENATIIGDVTIGKYSSIWYNTVLRGDLASIVIGENTSIQDGSIIHCDESICTIVGNNITVGHNAVLHACKIENGSLIGIGAIVLDEAEIGEGVIIGAGAIVTPRTKIPSYTMALGIPAKVVRELTDEEIESLNKHALNYIELMRRYK